MKIKGLQKLTLLDFPERIACTVFLGGCNFRCPFCHNASVVLPGRECENISESDFFEFLESRKTRLGGVCVSGGEPTLSPELPIFLSKIKKMGFAVKLDTNGYRPDVLKNLIDAGLVDYVAMDIKNSKGKYGVTVGIEKFDPSPILESTSILMKAEIPFEFRTTVTRELHTPDDIRMMGEWLSGEEKFYLQTFEDSGDLIGSGYSAYGREEMENLLKILKEYVPNAAIR